eukprot:scaffold121892_cov49-Prasinocladus_malaysianus.AAC.1
MPPRQGRGPSAPLLTAQNLSCSRPCFLTLGWEKGGTAPEHAAEVERPPAGEVRRRLWEPGCRSSEIHAWTCAA